MKPTCVSKNAASTKNENASFFKKSYKGLISVIVTTYNWPLALKAVLQSLIQQTDPNYEIIIADDGSGDETRKIIHEFQQHSIPPIHHVWHSDEGFRAAAIRNKAILASKGDYIIFLDGDCIPLFDFVANHRRLSQANYFISGNRILLSEAFTQTVLSEGLVLTHWSFVRWFFARLKSHCNRILPLIRFPKFLIHLRSVFKKFSYCHQNKWQGAKGCNLSMWKHDLIEINGWEETFKGWGYEDSDLVFRLFRSGISRKEGRFWVPVIHLWHPENDRSLTQSNWNLLMKRNQTQLIMAESGLQQSQTFPS